MDDGLSFPDHALELVEVRCGRCGYGARARRAPPSCPMCQANEWQPLGRHQHEQEPLAPPALSGVASQVLAEEQR
jgi:hypothetical protein